MLDNDDGDDDDGTCLQPVASSTNSILLPMARPRNKFYLLTYLLTCNNETYWFGRYTVH